MHSKSIIIIGFFGSRVLLDKINHFNFLFEYPTMYFLFKTLGKNLAGCSYCLFIVFDAEFQKSLKIFEILLKSLIQKKLHMIHNFFVIHLFLLNLIKNKIQMTHSNRKNIDFYINILTTLSNLRRYVNFEVTKKLEFSTKIERS